MKFVMWLAFLFFVAAFNSFHRQKFVTCVALALIILGYLYPGAYFPFVDLGLLALLWIQRPTRILVGAIVSLVVTVFTFSLMPYSTIPAYLSYSHYFLSLTLSLCFSEDSLVGMAVLISVFNNQIAVGITLLYDLVTGYQALKKAGLLPKSLVR